MCWSSFLLHKLAFADWIRKATLSSIVSDTLVTSQKLLAYCSNDSHRLLMLKHAGNYLYWLAPVKSIHFKRQHFFSQCGGKVGPNIKWFVPTLLVIFFPFCFGRYMQITKGTVSHLSWERWDQPSCLMWKHCYFFFFFYMQRQIKLCRLSYRHYIYK